MLACGIFCNYKAVSSELSSLFINNSLNQWRIFKSSPSLCSCTRSSGSCSGWLIPHRVLHVCINLRVWFWERRLQPANSTCKYKASFLFSLSFFFWLAQGFGFFPEGGSERKKITPLEDLGILLQNRWTSTVFYPFPPVPMSADNENYSSYKVLIQLWKGGLSQQPGTL